MGQGLSAFCVPLRPLWLIHLSEGYNRCTMKEDDYRIQLRSEGFTHIYTWQDRPGTFYPDHTHPTLSAHIILDGEMSLTQNGQSRTYRPGERCDVPANCVHNARMGPEGCRYLIGEK